MQTLIFYASPVIGFVFMLTLIMAFVRMAAGRQVQQKQMALLIGSFFCIVGMIIYITFI